MLFQFLRFFFSNFRISGAILIGGGFGLIVGLLFFEKFPLLVLLCAAICAGLLLTDSWWHGLFKK